MKKNEITIVEKPDTISYESINELLHIAHESNVSKGLIYGTANQSIEELKRKLNKNSICFVALDGGKLVGTGTIEFRSRKFLFTTFNIACLCLAGVFPEYKGNRIADRLLDKRIETANERGYKFLYSSSAEDNLIIRNMMLKRGFVKVDYFTAKANNFYSVRYLKHPYQSVLLDFILGFIYKLRRFYVRFR